MSHIKKGDRVIVTTGRDKGKKGEVLKIFPKEDRAQRAGERAHHAPPCRMNSTQAAVSTTHASDVGRNTFQPSRMSWS